jgi:exonuclease III
VNINKITTKVKSQCDKDQSVINKKSKNRSKVNKFNKNVFSLLNTNKKIKTNVKNSEGQSQKRRKKIQELKNELDSDYTNQENTNEKDKYLLNHKENNYYNYNWFKLIKSNDVETNPGPKSSQERPPIPVYSKDNFVIGTYNVQGCKAITKMKRLGEFLRQVPFRKNCVIFLQETHLDKDDQSLASQWKQGLVQSSGRGAAGGVAIIYNKTYFDSIIKSKKDEEGRLCSVTVVKDDTRYLFINIYAPNNQSDSINFFSEVEEWILEELENDSSTQIILGGDFNFVVDPEVDSVGRNQSALEKVNNKLFSSMITRLKLEDTYRSIHNYGGFTWGRNNPQVIRSRLDRIYVSRNIIKNVLSSTVTKYPNESDHNFLYTELNLNNIDYGPGIIRCNASLFNDSEMKENILKEIEVLEKGLPIDLNAHVKLDYFKMQTRQIMLKYGRLNMKRKKDRLLQSNEEFSRLNSKLEMLVSKAYKPGKDMDEALHEIDEIKIAIEIAEIEIMKIKKEEAEQLIFKSRAKWAEDGERSTKYFLTLLKERQKKMQIRKLISNGVTYLKQNEIEKAIATFYKSLYSKQEELSTFDSEDDLFTNLPKLSAQEQDKLSKDLTLNELSVTLRTCKESAPGADGISYDVYKHIWHYAGPLIMNAWNHSCRIGQLPESQRESVITLLEKKGKDQSKIENLRPISLSNCDIKLCTKALALRTNSILHKLLGNTQTGYVPGRQVNDNSRMIEELIHAINNEDERAYLITLDAQKAFDSVDHNYILKLLKVYGFPDKYISWVKVIYTNLKATVLVNGYFTEKFDIKQSVKQGDALSCALFALAIEPLTRAIEKNKKIIPVEMKGGNEVPIEVKCSSFADDITAICKNEEGIQEVITTYEKYSKYSGIHLNVSKTEILVIGKKNKDKKEFKITHRGQLYKIYDQEKVKICGITYSNDKEIAYSDNVLEKIDKFERQLIIWRQRNLTLAGKILIVKTFGLSQLIYSMQATSFRNTDLIKIENIIYKFIWNIKPTSSYSSGRISRNTIKRDYFEGGLKAPCIFTINDAIKYKFALHSRIVDHPINGIMKIEMAKAGINWNDYTCRNTNYKSTDYITCIAKIHKVLGEKMINDLIQLCNDDDTKLNVNYYSFLQNINLKESNYVSKHQIDIVNKLKQNKIETLGNIMLENSNKKLDFYINSIKLSFPKIFIKALNRTRKIYQSSFAFNSKCNVWKNVHKIELSDVKNRLVELNRATNVIDYKVYINKRVKIDLEYKKNPFLYLRKQTNDCRVRNVQYKLLHNIYPTMDHLFKWKIKPTPYCTHCNVVETLRHVLFDCPIAKKLWETFQGLMTEKPTLTLSNIVLGLGCTPHTLSYDEKRINCIDNVLVELKRKLILQREEKKTVCTKEVINLIESMKRIESYKKKCNNKIWAWVISR